MPQQAEDRVLTICIPVSTSQREAEYSAAGIQRKVSYPSDSLIQL